jgi:hippurate hydrolase
MTIVPEIRAMTPLLEQWRHDLHMHPELAFEEHRTAAFIARELREMGLEVHEGLAGTGVVGVLRNGDGPSIGLRADIDALPVQEATGLPFASQTPGRMHACGHDGHTTMLLGAARHMAAHPPGPGTVVFIFQPAEENEGGARVMVDQGLFDQFPVSQVFAMHNWPGLPPGEIAVHAGPVMAALDTFELRITGKGSHAAMPHEGIDPITLAAQIQMAWQTIISRAVSPTEPAVISITQFIAGDNLNVIPEQAILRGTVRCFSSETQDLLQSEMTRRAEMIADACHARAKLTYERRYPATLNNPQAVTLAMRAAETTVGQSALHTDIAPSMAAEDFSFMLNAVPGAYVWLGNGSADGGCILHSPTYRFNDAILPTGVQYFVEVVRQAMQSNVV